jgi:hypothetical protein
MSTEPEGYFIAGVGVLIVLLIVGMGWLLVADANRWAEFSTMHHCRITAHMSGDVFTTVGATSNGGIAVGVGSTADKTGYLCDDGVTYWRE